MRADALDGAWSPVPLDAAVAEAFQRHGVEIVTCRLDVSASTIGELMWLLSSEERQRATHFRSNEHRRRFIVRRGRLRQMLAARLGVRAESICLEADGFGKPMLAADSAPGATSANSANSENSALRNLRFSLSHCGDIALLGLTRGREIGVDIEAVRDICRTEALAIAHMQFAAAERRQLDELDGSERAWEFHRAWTRREAWVKATGKGLLDSPAQPKHSPSMRWQVFSFAPAAGFIAAAVVQGRSPAVPQSAERCA